MRPWRPFAGFALLALSSVAWPAAAASPVAGSSDSVVTLPAVRVVAPSEGARADALRDVSLVTRDQLQADAGQSLAQILGRVPGIQFTSSGGPQTVTNLYLRGASPAQTLVLLNGIRINGATTAGVLLPAIDPAHVDHVEVVRGAAASRCGADAVGGAINIVTTGQGAGKPLAAWADLGGGSDGTVGSSLGLSGSARGWDYRLVASATHSRGTDATWARLSNGQVNALHDPDRDGYDSHALSGALGYAWRAGHRLEITAYDGVMRGSYDAGLSGGDPDTRYRQQVYGLQSTDRLTRRWQSRLSVGFTRDSIEDRSEAPNTTVSSARHYRWANDLELSRGNTLTLFFEHRAERVGGTVEYARNGRNLNALGLIYAWERARWRVEASAREDWYSGIAHRATGSLALAYDVNSALQAGVGASTALRMPTFNDLYYPGFFGLYAGNPDLQPETSRNVEAHLAYAEGPVRWRLTMFQNTVDGLISTSPIVPYSPRNIGRARLRGLSLDGTVRLAGTTLRAGVDLLDPRNERPGPGEASWLPLRARQVFRAGVQQRVRALTLEAQFQYVGNRPDAYTQARLGGYALVNLSARYAFTRAFSATLRLDNALDRRYAPLDGYRGPGMRVFLNLSWRAPGADR